MKLPWKKDKEVKELPADATTFQKLWHNKQTHGMLVLGMWMVFIIGVFILTSILSAMTPKTPVKEEQKVENVETLLTELQSSNYKYEYIIKKGEETIIFNGEIKDKVDSGYKETSEEIIKYLIEEDNTYRLFGDVKENIDYLYTDINTDYINANTIYLMVFGKNYTEEKKDDIHSYTYTVLSNNETEISVKVTFRENNISEIAISDNEVLYTLKYSDIKLVNNNQE